MIGKLIMDQIVNHVDVFYTEKQDDAKNEAMSMKKGEYDFVVAIGGDGTLNEVVNGVALGKNETPIAVISAGTVNIVMFYTKTPRYIDKATSSPSSGNKSHCSGTLSRILLGHSNCILSLISEITLKS